MVLGACQRSGARQVERTHNGSQNYKPRNAERQWDDKSKKKLEEMIS